MRLARHALVMSAVLASATACSGSGWHWTDPRTHIVDGFYVGDERPCALAAPSPSSRPPHEQDDISLCTAAVETAQADLATREPTARIVGAAMAAAPTAWVDGGGEPHVLIYGGLAQPMFVLLTLASGERHTLPLFCMGNAYAGSGQVPAWPAHCQPSEGSTWRVGAPAPPS